jgi:uncharacterized protein (DUF488 family)
VLAFLCWRKAEETVIELATIGYERAGVEDFVAALRAARVRVLLDVRAVPWSQRPEFRKAALAGTLAAAGIGYEHLPGLGNPRRRAGAGPDSEPIGDFAAFFRRHLASEAAAPDLSRAADLARQGGACLMCLEKDPNRCHRRFVAEALGNIAPLTVRHLVVESVKAPRLPL